MYGKVKGKLRVKLKCKLSSKSMSILKGGKKPSEATF